MAKEGDQLSTSVIHRLETGSGAVTVSALARYAEVLGIHPKALLDFSKAERTADAEAAMPRVYSIEDKAAAKKAFRTVLPLYSLQAAAGYFGSGKAVEPESWIDARSIGRLDERMFVVRVAGRSMEPRMHHGDYAVFRANPTGTRQGKIVLAQYRGPADPETGGSYTVKKYSSTKVVSQDGSWAHKQVVLAPLNREFEPIVLPVRSAGDFIIVGEFVGVLKGTEHLDLE